MHNIFLYGPPGSGKTTVGRALAKNLSINFFDTDVEIEKEYGLPFSQMIHELGIQKSRENEAYVIQSLCKKNNGAVISLGGGALLREENLQLCMNHGDIVFLETDIETLNQRLADDKNQRPLLDGKLRNKLADLLEQRKDHYSTFKVRVATSNHLKNRNPKEISSEIQKLLGRYYIGNMGTGYDVIVEDGGFDSLPLHLQRKGINGKLTIVWDKNVSDLYSKSILNAFGQENNPKHVITIPPGEKFKNLETVNNLWNGFVQGNLDRNSTVVAVGGGVVSDLVGFASSTYMRGCQWVAIPTTLLSMVDASLGGKTGFDLPQGKNLIGSFYPPRLVLANSEFLATLPDPELRSGIAEVIKHGIIGDFELYEFCTQGFDVIKDNLPWIVRRAIGVKARIIEKDPYEVGVRASLNLGHTIGHAVEIASEFQLRHGEAISIGMVYESRLAEELGIAKRGLSESIESTLTSIGLPIRIPEWLSRDQIVEAIKIDKKKDNKLIKFALPVKIGKVKVGVIVEDLGMVI